MIRKRLPTTLVLLSIIGSLTSCGTLINGINQKIPVTTNPPGATVTDGINTWQTPCVIKLRRKRDHILTFTMKGYEPQAVILKRQLSPASAGNIILPGGLVFLGIDAISGGLFRLRPKTINIQLKPQSPFSSSREGDSSVEPQVKDELKKILDAEQDQGKVKTTR